MRLHRICLINFRGVTRSEIHLAPQGITIIEGENEVGKSSLAEALHLLFELPDSSNASSIKAVKAAGIDAGAEVEVEMSVGEYRFTYRKRWHRDRETVLVITEPRRQQFSGREAHDKVTTILDERLDADLWAALQITQGAELSLPSFAVPTLGQALDLAAGGTANDDHTALWDRICSERLRYWTPSGQPRKERLHSAAELAEARNGLHAVNEALEQLDADVRGVAQLEIEASELSRQRSELQRSADQFERRAEHVEQLAAQVIELDSHLRLAQSTHQRLTDQNEHRRGLTAVLNDHHEAIESLQARSLAAEHRRQRASTARSTADHAVDVLLRRLRDAEQERGEIEACVEHLQLKDEVQRLSDQLNQAQEAEERRVGALSVLQAGRVDDALLAQMESATIELLAAETVARSDAPSVDVVASSAVVVVVDGIEHRLDAGDTRTDIVTGVTHIEIPGLIRLRVNPGADSTTAVRRVEELAAHLSELCAAGGVDDVSEAREAHAAHHRCRRDLAEAESDLQRILGEATPDSLERRIPMLTDQLAGTAPLGADTADLDTSRQLLAEATTRCRELQQALDDARAEATQCAATCAEIDVQHATVTATLHSTRSALQAAEAQLANERVMLSDDDLESSLQQSTQQLSDLQGQRATAERMLDAEHPGDLRRLVENARSAIDRNQEAIHHCQDRIRQLRIRLELEGERGLHQQLNDSLAKVDHLEAAHEATETRAVATELLYDTFSRHRTLSRQRHIAPFTDRIEQLGRIVFGPDLEVELGADLSVARRTLNGVTLEADSLSVGAREQLAVISRLACASLVSDHGGAPVMLDDALGWSDPSRLEAMGAAIAIAGRDCQVIILTCTPGRYANVGGATVVRLSSDRDRERAR